MTTDASRPAVSAASGGEGGEGSRRLLSHAARCLFGASLGGLFVAFADAHFAYHAGSLPAAARLPLLVADAGVVAPFALLVGGMIAAASVVLFVPPPTLSRFASSLRSGDDARAGSRAASIVVTSVLGVLGLVGVAHAARRVLGAEIGPRQAGAALAFVAVVLLLVLDEAVESASAAAAGTSPPPGRVRAALTLALAFVGLILAAGIVTGTPNGDGGFLGILGVLSREELDLRGVGLLVVIAGAAFLAPSIVSARAAPVVAAASLLPLVATWYAAGSGLADRRIALALERGAPLGSGALGVLRRFGDRDRDGASARFGGGDCDDHNPRIFPGADDVPGDGIDQDCSGEDEHAPPAPPAPAVVRAGSWVAEHFPGGLNVILVTIDTLRADLGFSGNPRPVSPNLDALAARSTVFEHAYSLASYTGKSMGPLLLGKYPSETERTFEHFDSFSAGETFVQERLRRAGRKTLTAQAHWYFEPKSGLGRGFDVSDYSAEPRVPQMEGDRTVNGDVLTDKVLALLSRRENVGGPFYLWVHYVDPHAAYVPHPGFDFGSTSRDLYDGEVAFVDAQIGRVLSFVERSSFAGKTAIVVTSDHGEAFGEHGMLRHGREVWEELVHVPLLIYVPTVAPHRVRERRSAIDLVPTLLDLASAPMPSGEGRDFVSGRSLLPDVVGTPAGERPVLVDMAEGPYNEERQAFFEGRYKLVATHGRPIGLYDVVTDPGERDDLLGKSDVEGPAVAAFKAFRRTLRPLPAKR